MFKKYKEWRNSFYGWKDLLSSDKEYRRMVWKKYGIASSLILILYVVMTGIMVFFDKLKEKKRKQFIDSIYEKEESSFEELREMTEKYNASSQLINFIIKLIIIFISFIMEIKICNKFWKKK